MTIEEIAIKKGVPLPETCKRFEKEQCFLKSYKRYPNTYWVWLKLKNNNDWFLASLEADNQYYLGYPESEIEFCLPAPQFHEIMSVLPKKIKLLDNEIFYLSIDHDSVVYKHPFAYCFNIDIKDNHFSETIAELYLKLKNEGIIS